MASVTYNLRTTGDIDQITNPVFIIRAVRINNHSGDTIVFDNGVQPPVDVPAGTTPIFNQDSLISGFKVHTKTRTTGSATAIVYDYPQDDTGNQNLQQLPGTVTITPAGDAVFTINPGGAAIFTINPALTAVFTITPNAGATFTITPSGSAIFTVTPNAGAVFNVTPNGGAIFNVAPSGAAIFTITPNAGASFVVAPAGGATFTIAPAGAAVFTITGSVVIASGSITINNSGPITTISPDAIATYVVLNNSSTSVTLSRQAGQITVQPVLATLARGGLLDVTATDSTTQTYEFIEDEPIQYYGLIPLGPMLPYVFTQLMKSGAVVKVAFTGNMGFIISYA